MAFGEGSLAELIVLLLERILDRGEGGELALVQLSPA